MFIIEKLVEIYLSNTIGGGILGKNLKKCQKIMGILLIFSKALIQVRTQVHFKGTEPFPK